MHGDAEHLLETRLRLGNEARLVGGGLQRREHGGDGADWRVMTAEPGAIEALAEVAGQPRRRHHHGDGSQGEEPRPGAVARQLVEQRQHHDEEGAQGDERRQQHRAALDQQVVELEAILVVGGGRQEQQRRHAHHLSKGAEAEGAGGRERRDEVHERQHEEEPVQHPSQLMALWCRRPPRIALQHDAREHAGEREEGWRW